MPQHRLITKSHRRHGCFPVDVWALYYNQDFFNLLCVLNAGGNAVSKTADLAAGMPTESVRAVAASASQRVNVASIGASSFTLGHSDDNGGTWTEQDLGIANEEVGSIQIASDRTNRDLVWAINDFGQLTDPLRDALANQVSLSGVYGPLSGAAYTSWFTDGKPLYIWCSTDGGVTYNSVRLDWLMQVLPTRLMNNFGNYGGVSYTDDCVYSSTYTRTASDPACTTAPGQGFTHQNDSAFWLTKFPTLFAQADNVWGYASPGIPDLGIYVDVTSPGVSVLGYQTLTAGILSPPARGDLVYMPPGGGAFLCPRHDNAGVYVITSILWYVDTITETQGFDGGGGALTEYVWPLRKYHTHFPNTQVSNYIYKVESDLSYSRQDVYPGWGISQAVPDPTDDDAVFTIDFDGDLVRYNWGANAIVRKPITSLPFAGAETGVFVTSQGTILVGDWNDGAILRSVDRGDNWTVVDVSALTFYPELMTGISEYGGTLGTPGVIVIASSDGDGTFLFSIDDGASWAKTADLSSHDYPESVAAR